jgi:nucleoside-diphosphate-sugar epimerase
VTGASGYLGGHVLNVLARTAVPSMSTSRSGRVGERCDLTDAAATRALLEQTEPSAVIHCAAGVPQSLAAYDDADGAAASVEMTSTLARHARCPILLASSMTVYGANPCCPVDEESRPDPDSAYARGKLTAEQRLFERGRAGDMALRLPGLFGLPRRSGVLYNAITGFLTRGRFDLHAPVTAWAAMSVQDAAQYLVKAATSATAAPAFNIVNVGYEGAFSVGSAVARIASLCGVEWHPTSADRPFSMRLDRLASRYGNLPVTFERRLAEFVNAVRHDLALERAVRP